MTPRPSGLVPAVGTARRLRALAALGWPLATLRGMSGLAAEALAHSGADHLVDARTAARAVALYDRLSMTVGPCPVTRYAARCEKWAPPLGWDDDGQLDDPAAEPVVDDAPTSRSRDVDDQAVEAAISGRRVHLGIGGRQAAVARLVAAGLNDREAAERLRITRRTVQRIRRRLSIPPARPCNRPTAISKGAA